MPVFIRGGVTNVNNPAQNCGVFFGQNTNAGWDANMKLNIAHGADYGRANIATGSINVTLDNAEVVDGAMNDQDVKISPAVEL